MFIIIINTTSVIYIINIDVIILMFILLLLLLFISILLSLRLPKVAELEVGGPAHKAGVLPGDLRANIKGVGVKGKYKRVGHIYPGNIQGVGAKGVMFRTRRIQMH